MLQPPLSVQFILLCFMHLGESIFSFRFRSWPSKCMFGLWRHTWSANNERIQSARRLTSSSAYSFTTPAIRMMIVRFTHENAELGVYSKRFLSSILTESFLMISASNIFWQVENVYCIFLFNIVGACPLINVHTLYTEWWSLTHERRQLSHCWNNEWMDDKIKSNFHGDDAQKMYEQEAQDEVLLFHDSI